MYTFAFTLCYLGAVLIPFSAIAYAVVNHLMKGVNDDEQ